ncbi:site-specific integrase [Dyella tabacisoli]|uniref:site-specific integrase n=1 Tax=Dyella tabacisoli TaxID=2282381 RepID=UPI0013B44740|nr:site-specific integrase [Dyella tabacisoli]
MSDALPTLPTPEEVSRWLKGIRVRAPVKALAYEFMLRTGSRLSETNQIRAACFPNKEFEGGERWSSRWLNQGWVPVTLRYGVKGGKVEPASSLSTRSRTVQVPIDLAERIWDYKKLIRPTQLRRFKQNGAERDLSDGRLWLGERKSQPVSNTMLYRTWTDSLFCPKDWNPHDGRHFFAVEKVCEYIRQMMALHGKGEPLSVNVGWLHGLMAGQVRLILSPLMGHVTEETTMRYLTCAHQRLIETFGHPALDWNDLLDSDDLGDE